MGLVNNDMVELKIPLEEARRLVTLLTHTDVWEDPGDETEDCFFGYHAFPILAEQLPLNLEESNQLVVHPASLADRPSGPHDYILKK